MQAFRLIFGLKTFLFLGQTNFVEDLTQSRKPEFSTDLSVSSAQGAKRMIGEGHAGK